jgi:PAS domain S-box-containing protein
LLDLASGPASVSERTRADGRTIELRRNPTPDGGFVMLCSDITERKATQAAEAALASEQRMLALILQRTEQGFWFIDNDLHTTDANPAMCRMLGLSLQDVLGQSIYAFVDDANRAIFQEHVLLRAAGQAEGYEITLTRADGSTVHCYNNATPIFDAEGRKTGAVGLFSDISALKRAERKIRQTGDLLAQKSHVLEVTLESLSQGVLSIDSQGHINTWNHRLLELLQIPEAVLRERPSLDALRHYQVLNGLLGNDAHVGQERPALYQRTRSDGMVLEVQTRRAEDGSMVRTYTDVTASVQAQQALSESEARFRTMADAAPAFIWQSDAQGKATWFNQRWLQATGRSRQAELNCEWGDRIHATELDDCRAVFARAAQAQIGYSVEYRVRCADGAVCWIADRGIPRLSSDGRFEGFIVYGWDITERKASEAALIAARDEAERANRAKSEFLSRMSHELRTPLNAVLGFGQLMAADRQEPLGPQQSARIDELLRGGRHLLSLINEVLDLARIEAGTLHLQLVPVNVAEVVGDSLRLVEPMASERSITVSVAPGLELTGHVMADPTRLKQVLLNLLSNAIKYNRHKGTVQLACALDATTQQLRIEVRDSGPGLTSVQQDRLFQAFERLDAGHSKVEGAGIGLALSKWLVDLMRGEIGVYSRPGAGSTFWVSLGACDATRVLASEPAPALEYAPSPSMAAAGGTAASRHHTVLYIEDNAVNQLLMEGMLGMRPGIRLLVAGLPTVGLTMALQALPDLVLLDIQLPGMDGFEVLRHLKAAPGTQHVPVVAVSANAMPDDIAAAQLAGFADYVTKPLDLQRLLAVVDRLLPP